MAQGKHDLSYYLKCMAGGSLACGLTHTALIPLDMVRLNNLMDITFSKGLADGLLKVKAKKQMTLGWSTTLVGYSLYGMAKFGFYQFFKDIYKKIVGVDNANKYKKTGWVLASGSAEIIACYLLCPWQLIKIRIQLSRPGFQHPSSLIPAFMHAKNVQGIGGLFVNLGVLWGKQVPTTILKFVTFQCFVQFFYDTILTKGKENYSLPSQLGVTFASGYLSGILQAAVSHSAESIMIKRYVGKLDISKFWVTLRSRVMLIGTLTSCQWLIYDSFKTAMGLPTTGGKPSSCCVDE